jgi:hypothetical protein
MDLLTSYKHHSELQALVTLPLISTLHKSTQHLLSLFQAAVSSPAVPWQWFLSVEVLQLHALRTSCHSCPCRILANCQLSDSAIYSQPPWKSSTELVAPILFFITARRGRRRQHPVVCVTVAAGTCLSGRCQETDITAYLMTVT